MAKKLVAYRLPVEAIAMLRAISSFEKKPQGVVLEEAIGIRGLFFMVRCFFIGLWWFGLGVLVKQLILTKYFTQYLTFNLRSIWLVCLGLKEVN